MKSALTLSMNSMGSMVTTFPRFTPTFVVDEEVTTPSSQMTLFRVSPSLDASLKFLHRALMKAKGR